MILVAGPGRGKWRPYKNTSIGDLGRG